MLSANCTSHSMASIKQSARQWNKKLHSVLDSMGFKRTLSDNSIYIYSRNQVKLIVPIFIDNITLVSKDECSHGLYSTGVEQALQTS